MSEFDVNIENGMGAGELPVSNGTINPAQDGLQPPAEKLIPQSKANELIGRAKLEERERLQRALNNVHPQTQPVPQQMIGGIPQVNPDELAQIVQERLNATIADYAAKNVEVQQQEQAAKNVEAWQSTVNNFVGAIKVGPERYGDFDARVKMLGLGNPVFRPLIPLLNEIDNVVDVVYEFTHNPEKMKRIRDLAVHNSEAIAREQLSKYANSVKKNTQALAGHRKAPDPIENVNRSTAESDDGKPTVADLRKMDKYRR